MNSHNEKPCQWIETDAQLATLCEHLSQQTAIAIDTEFVRTRTYYPQIGLVQIADDTSVYLIDPLTLTDTAPMAALLSNASVVKVIHACSEDLEVFQHAFGELPINMFDTQIAAGFAGYGTSVGYANLLSAIKGIDVDKQETRSDWLQRPLSEAQLRYAALDVEYLLSIYTTLLSDLDRLGRVDWVETECLAIVEKLRNTDNAADYYLRIKSAWKLSPDQLSVLKALSRWREEQARETDVPRGRILKDPTLYDMAFKLPLDAGQMKRIQDISHRWVDHYSVKIIALINATLDAPTDYTDLLSPPLSREQTSELKQLKQQVNGLAEGLALPPELLMRKKDYEHFIRTQQLPPAEWRQALLNDVLLTNSRHITGQSS